MPLPSRKELELRILTMTQARKEFIDMAQQRAAFEEGQIQAWTEILHQLPPDPEVPTKPQQPPPPAPPNTTLPETAPPPVDSPDSGPTPPEAPPLEIVQVSEAPPPEPAPVAEETPASTAEEVATDPAV